VAKQALPEFLSTQSESTVPPAKCHHAFPGGLARLIYSASFGSLFSLASLASAFASFLAAAASAETLGCKEGN
jgi:hypothetical protein